MASNSTRKLFLCRHCENVVTFNEKSGLYECVKCKRKYTAREMQCPETKIRSYEVLTCPFCENVNIFKRKGLHPFNPYQCTRCRKSFNEPKICIKHTTEKPIKTEGPLVARCEDCLYGEKIGEREFFCISSLEVISRKDFYCSKFSSKFPPIKSAICCPHCGSSNIIPVLNSKRMLCRNCKKRFS